MCIEVCGLNKLIVFVVLFLNPVFRNLEQRVARSKINTHTLMPYRGQETQCARRILGFT